jgi:hypothetical protein
MLNIKEVIPIVMGQQEPYQKNSGTGGPFLLK